MTAKIRQEKGMRENFTEDKRKKTRRPLTRQRVLEGAMAVADEGGLGALTMRSLAQHLGVKPMSLYHHVANKEDLIDGLIDLVFSEIELPPSDTPWQEAIYRRTASARQVLARHPWATPHMESRPNPGPASLHHHEAVIATFRRAGFSVEATAHAYSLVDAYLYGFALQEAALPFDPDTAHEVAGSIMAEFPAGEYPYFEEFATEHVLQPGFDYGKEFRFGLGLILDALQPLHDSD